MSAHTRARRTDALNKAVVTVSSSPSAKRSTFRVPRAALNRVLEFLHEITTSDGTVSADDVFRDLDEKYGKSGAVLKGARLRLELTQKNLAEKTGIEQADLSKMENGKISIGRERAKRIAKVLNVDYRILL